MEIQNFLQLKASKVLPGMIGVFAAIVPARSGYIFGQWLHNVIN